MICQNLAESCGSPSKMGFYPRLPASCPCSQTFRIDVQPLGGSRSISTTAFDAESLSEGFSGHDRHAAGYCMLPHGAQVTIKLASFAA